MKNILLSILGVLSIVVSLAFSSYSVNAASNGVVVATGQTICGKI